MKKVVVAIVLVLTVFTLTAMAGEWTGYISDSKCGAKGANAGGEACTKKCLAAGAKMVIVTDGDQKVLAVDNPDALKGHEGHHVAVTGTMSKDSMKVESVKML